MRTPDGWPERPAFARFRIAVVDKPDGRQIAYYDWPDAPDADDAAHRVVASPDAAQPKLADDNV